MDLSWYDAIKSKRSFYNWRDFGELRKLVCHTWITKLGMRLGLKIPDNYFLYAVQMCIHSRAEVPIHTFKGPGPHYLCDVDGFQ